MKTKIILLSILLITISHFAKANTIKVPADQLTIQKAINSATNGDTVLVSPGTYFENVNFYKKSLVLTSHYVLNKDNNFISNTIINGSNPTHSDTASCILILNGQDTSTVVQGFTITGGSGTSWKDEHSSGTYREGGGIMVAMSSPTIQNNVIINNEAVNKKGLAGTGGGGIRCGDGSPRILNNVIVSNTGRYGAGIVLNWCGAIIKNNIIAGNIGGEDYGGGGLWINNTNGKINLIENNTIVNNHSFTNSGGILMYSSAAKATLINNIIFGNTAKAWPHISLGSNVNVTSCTIDGGWNGDHNISSLPEFRDSFFYLGQDSPAIDAGDTSTSYNDLPYDLNGTEALFPSLGTTTNDMGAYGGRLAKAFPYFQISRIGTMSTTLSFGNANVIGQMVKQKIVLINQGTAANTIDSIAIMEHKDQLKISHLSTRNLKPAQSDSIFLEWTPTSEQQFTDTILVYYQSNETPSVLKITITGKAKNTTGMSGLGSKSSLYNNPNPFQTVTSIRYTLAHEPSASLTVYDIVGRKVKTVTGLNRSGILEFDGSQLPAGTYIYRLTTANQIEYESKMSIQRE